MAWTLFLLYLAGTAYLGWLGYRRTTDFGSFAIGKGDMHPVVVGVTLAASTASAATFIINPGFIYVDGLSAWIHMVPATGIGILFSLSILSFRFRRIGAEAGALTIPDWIGKRYKSQGFALYFSVLTLLSFAFVVLLVGGISIVMQQLLGLSNTVALLITLVFVTGYVFIGGTYAHVLTNLLQGSLMIGVTLLILATSVWATLDHPTPIIERLTAIDPNLIAPINREGQLFNNVFSIYVAGLIVGFVVVGQPHILTKALYVDSDRDVRNYLIVFGIVISLFLLLGTVGFFAHLAVPADALVDPSTGQFRQDLVMTVYLKTVFPDWVFTIISVVLLAAAMSTLDGLLVSISTITANDLVLNVVDRLSSRERTDEQRMRLAMYVSHAVLVLIAVLAFLVNLDPPRLLGVFGQVGVYGLVVATAAPLLAGVLFRDVSVSLAWLASLLALGLHLMLYQFGAQLFPESTITYANPGVTASIAATVTIVPLLLYGVLTTAKERQG